LLWFGLAAFVALRERERPWAPILFLPALALFSLWFARAATAVFLPFVLALVSAYLLDPLVDRLESRLGRTRAILLLALPGTTLLVFFFVFLVPAVMAELQLLAQRLPELRETLLQSYEGLIARAADWGIRLDRERVAQFLWDRAEAIGSTLGSFSLGILRGVQGIVDVLSFLVILPVFTFYLLRDYDALQTRFLEAIGPQAAADTIRFLHRVDRSIHGYLRGQILVGLLVGALFFIGLSLLGMQYALLVGLSAVFLNLVPFVGSAMTALLALCVALLSDPSLASLLKVGLLFAAIQTLDAAIISPRIVAGQLALHPIVVMLALLLGGRFFGVVGVVLAVPTAAVLKETLLVWTPELLRLWPRLSRGERED
jgi:predicted PurR-regulated permease PerM